MTYKKKLIEVVLPLDAINKAFSGKTPSATASEALFIFGGRGGSSSASQTSS